MDLVLDEVTRQAKNYVFRCGMNYTGGYVGKQGWRLIKSVRGPGREEIRGLRDELESLQGRLQSKIRIISPAIDMIELIAARGNTSLESAVSLTKALRLDIQNLGQRLEKAAASEEINADGCSANRRALLDAEIRLIIKTIRNLLIRIEDAVPLINLAITTSGAKLSTSLPSTVSPSRLLQASTFLTAGDTRYSFSPTQPVQVGPTFTLSVYLLFSGHVRSQDEEHVRETTWKEVIHKARVKLRRTPMDMDSGSLERPDIRDDDARADKYSYQILIIEDFDDGRVHSFDDDEPKPGPFEDVAEAGIRETIPVHQISKIFYADTGRILNIGTEGETNNPVLLLKRDVNAVPPRRMIDRQELLDYDEPLAEENELPEEYADEQSQLDAQLLGSDEFTAPPESHDEPENDEHWRFPPGLDLEWIAFEVHLEDSDSDDEEDEIESPSTPEHASKSQYTPVDDQLNARMESLRMNEKQEKLSSHTQQHQQVSTVRPSPPQPHHQQPSSATISNPLFNNIRTSLSLLETLLRLTSLQQFQQQSHLSITDELLNFFLEESSTTGAGGDEQHRQQVRAEARRKVGWDPYDESPLKRRGEEYQYHADAGSDVGHEGAWINSPSRSRIQSKGGVDEDYDRGAGAGGTPQSQNKTRAGGDEYQYGMSPSDRRARVSSRRVSPGGLPGDSDSAASVSPSSSPSTRPRRAEGRRAPDLRRQIPSNKLSRQGA